MAGPKSKIVRGALEALTDVTDEAIDVGRREFLKKTPVGAAGVATGLGTGVALGAKALFTKGKFDDIINNIKSSIDDLAEDYDWDAFMETNKMKESDLADILEPMYGMRDEKLPEIIDMLENADDIPFSESIQDIKVPLFTRELLNKFPGLDPSEIDELANKLF